MRTDFTYDSVIGVHTSLVIVYDSMFKTAGTCLALQTAAINFFKTDSDEIVSRLKEPWSQFQQGKVNCGLYAISFATELLW